MRREDARQFQMYLLHGTFLRLVDNRLNALDAFRNKLLEMAVSQLLCAVVHVFI